MIIQVIAPITRIAAREQVLTTYTEAARPECTVQAVCLDTGPMSIETFFEDNIAAPDILKHARLAENGGADAVIIDCMNDPGLEAARELVDIPVVGAAQSAMLLASLLAHRFSVISTGVRDVYPVEHLVARYGLQEKYASTRSVDVPVLDLEHDRQLLLDIMTEKSIEAVLQDGAHAIVFGCTGMKGMAQELHRRLLQQGLDIIFIDPSLAALKLAEALVDLKLSHSRLAYAKYTKCAQHSAEQPVDNSARTVQNLASATGRLYTARRIAAILPQKHNHNSSSDALKKDWAILCHEGSNIELYRPDDTPPTMSSRAAAALLAPDIFRNVKKAQADGADAIIIAAMMEPGLEGARELSRRAVVGMAQASFFMASAVCERFSVIGTEAQGLLFAAERARACGAERKLASVRTVADDEKNGGRHINEALLDETEKAIEQDGAQAIVLAAPDYPQAAGRLWQALHERGFYIPLIEPAACAVKVAEIVADLSLTHSRRTYPPLPQKELVGYADLEQK